LPLLHGIDYPFSEVFRCSNVSERTTMPVVCNYTYIYSKSSTQHKEFIDYFTYWFEATRVRTAGVFSLFGACVVNIELWRTCDFLSLKTQPP